MPSQIFFKKATGDRKTVWFSDGLSLSAAKNFAKALAQYSTAPIVKAAYIQTVEITDSPGSTGRIETTDLTAKVMLKKSDNSGKRREVIIPAPKENILEFVEHRGYRVIKSKGVAIAAAYSTFAGETYEFVDGWLTGGGP